MRRTGRRAAALLALVAVIALGPGAPAASGQGESDGPTLNAGGEISYPPAGGAVPIDDDLTIEGDADGSLEAAIVSIGGNSMRTDDALGITGQGGASGTVEGLDWAFEPATGTMTISGDADLATYQAALRQVTFSSAEGELDSERLITISLGAPIPYIDNGHFYQFVSAPTIGWTDAAQAAEATTYAGMQGYLVTVTSAEENTFVADTVVGKGWIGASDADIDKEWYWVTGPEAGTHFFTQASADDGCGAGAAEEQPVGDHYENWDPGPPEPNDFPTGCEGEEDYGNLSDDGLWNDWPESGAEQAFGYIVEYGGLEGAPSQTTLGTVRIQPYEPSITIEAMAVGSDPDVAITFTVAPEIEGCAAEQTATLPAGQGAVVVPVDAEAEQTACTYTVTPTVSGGYTVAPDEATGVGVDETVAFTSTSPPPDSLPDTGSPSPVAITLGLVLVGSGWLLLAGRRRAVGAAADAADTADPLPGIAWTETGPVRTAHTGSLESVDATAGISPAGSADSGAGVPVTRSVDAAVGICSAGSADSGAGVPVTRSVDAAVGICSAGSADSGAGVPVTRSVDAAADSETDARLAGDSRRSARDPVSPERSIVEDLLDLLEDLGKY